MLEMFLVKADYKRQVLASYEGLEVLRPHLLPVVPAALSAPVLAVLRPEGVTAIHGTLQIIPLALCVCVCAITEAMWSLELTLCPT